MIFFRSECRRWQRKMAVKEDFAQDYFRWEKRAFHHLLLVLQCFRVKKGDLWKDILAMTVFLHSPNPNTVCPENKVKNLYILYDLFKIYFIIKFKIWYMHTLINRVTEVDYCLVLSLSLPETHIWQTLKRFYTNLENVQTKVMAVSHWSWFTTYKWFLKYTQN